MVAHPSPLVKHTPPETTDPTPRSYLGEVAGAAGNAYCFAAALDPYSAQVVYLDLAGAKSGVLAVWALLSDAQAHHKSSLKVIHLANRWELALTPAPGARYLRYQREVTRGLDHLILLDSRLADPVYGESSTTYLLYADAAQAVAQSAHHITATVNLPVFPDWHTYLWAEGLRQGLIKRCLCYGGVLAYRLNLVQSAWTQLITTALHQQTLRLPFTAAH